MALIALAADKGAPGVTTAAVALAAVWPRRTLLAEVDTAGGDLVYRSPGTDGRPLDPNTGMLSLAAAARRGLAPEQLWDHAQRLSGGLDVLVGLGAAEQSAGLAGQWDTVGRAFASLADTPHPQLAADVIADCGRIGPEAASVALFPHAALVLLLARGEPEQIARVRDRALALTGRLHGGQRGMAPLAQPLIGVVLVAEAQGAAKVASQVNDMLVASRAGAQVVGVLAHDPPGAQQLAGRRRGRVDRSLLVRSVRKVATDLHEQYAAAWTGGPDEAARRQAAPQPSAPHPFPAPGQPGPAAQGLPGGEGTLPPPQASSAHAMPAAPPPPLDGASAQQPPAAPWPPPPAPSLPVQPVQPAQDRTGPGGPAQAESAPGRPVAPPSSRPAPPSGAYQPSPSPRPAQGEAGWPAPAPQQPAPPGSGPHQPPQPVQGQPAQGEPAPGQPGQGEGAGEVTQQIRAVPGRQRPSAPEPTPPLPLPGRGGDEGAAS